MDEFAFNMLINLGSLDTNPKCLHILLKGHTLLFKIKGKTHVRSVWENAFLNHTVNYATRASQGKFSPLRQQCCKRD